MREPSARSGCPAPEDLTALAHGEGPGPARAALLRHVLACPACHTQHEASRGVLLALRGLGAARASHAPVSAARRLALRWRWALLPPAVAAAAVALALVVPFGRSAHTPPRALPLEPGLARAASAAPSPPSALPSPLPMAPNVETLLSAQRPDGRWGAEPGLGGRAGDEAATALVLLALLQPGAQALRNETVARAVATGSRWLVARAALLAPSERASPADVRARAVVSAALLRVESLTHDVALRPAARSLLAAVTMDAAASADHASRPWLDYALATAEEAGWPGAEHGRRTLAAAPRPVEPHPSRGALSGSPSTESTAGTPVRWALDWTRTAFSAPAR